jgi:hypothetical protein
MKTVHSTSALVAITCALLSTTAFAAESDKSGYNLFNPTPVEKMRDMSTDRPDQTESPFTVDAGHFQIEADIVKYTYDRYKANGENTRTKTWNAAPVNLKAGLTNSTDLQIVLDNYVHRTDSDKAAGTRETTDGFGDVTIRLKHNLWGNDGGKTAFALMPYVKVPTNQNDLENDDLEGGLIAPLAIDLGDGYGLGLMTQLDILKDADDSGYHPAFVNTATFAVEWTEKLGSYYEIFTEKGTDTGDRWAVSFDTGVTYGLTDNIQLDAGINIGVTEAADDYQPFLGATYRF